MGHLKEMIKITSDTDYDDDDYYYY